MSKAILKINMPENCLTCSISDYQTSDSGEELFCPVLGIEIENYIERHKDCPLKEVFEEDSSSEQEVLKQPKDTECISKDEAIRITNNIIHAIDRAETCVIEEEKNLKVQEYRIRFDGKQWIAVEKHPDNGTFLARMEFNGYGDTPEAALKEINKAHVEFEKALREI